MSTVPKAITRRLRAFCAGISSHQPVYIRAKPSADAEPSACFDNVSRKIARAGGSIAYGWAIWHVPSLYFEAEHHGVWRNRQGALLDVSPQLVEASKIVFLPDPDAVYDPVRFRPNVIQAVDDTPLAVEFAELANDRNALLNDYRALGQRVAMLSAADQTKLGAIDRRLRELWALAGVNLQMRN